ncbi:redoxin domain-containing protein [uncultured bacterium]|nr:redoxin domain-containing protein [uncultured bacterium]
MMNIYDFKATEVSGQPIDFSDYKGKVIIVVNTASKCGFAKELKGLEALYKEYHQDGLEVVGFPSNQFRQELSSSKKASQYCKMHYGVTFPMTTIVKVNGKDAAPIFKYLKKESGHGFIKWNYTKFLIGRNGKLIHRYATPVMPKKMEPAIVKALQTK